MSKRYGHYGPGLGMAAVGIADGGSRPMPSERTTREAFRAFQEKHGMPAFSGPKGRKLSGYKFAILLKVQSGRITGGPAKAILADPLNQKAIVDFEKEHGPILQKETR